MRAVVTAAEMRNAEKRAASLGMPGHALMYLAGHAATAALLRRAQAAEQRYLVLVGPGNNGGDALVVAALLTASGASVRIAMYHRAPENADSKADPQGTTEALVAVPRFDCGSAEGLKRLAVELTWCTTVIDGVLGTGRSRPLPEDLIQILQLVNAALPRPEIVALDLPTGVDVDTGQVDSHALRANRTLTFGYLKRGLVLHPARAYCGEIEVLDIGLPVSPAVAVEASIVDPQDVARWIPKREETAQKYSAGAVLAISGSPHYVGAPILACRSAMRSGAGYVTLAIPAKIFPVIAGQLLEATLLELPDEDALGALQKISSRYGALLVGPGLGRDDHSMQLVLQIIAGQLQGPRAAVVDADALYALSRTPGWSSTVKIPLVLTPHSGEMSRLSGVEASSIERDRFAAAAHYAREWNQVLVLKGAPTIVADPLGRMSVNPTGNPLLATAGTGDILAGCISALLAGGAAPYDAARAGVYIHGYAADLAIQSFGDRGMVAGDLLPLLPVAIRQILHNESSARGHR